MTTITPERRAKIQHLIDNRQRGIVVLEDISDPHNAAAVLRSCDAFGFHKVYFIFHEEKGFDPERVGKLTSASANKWLEFTIFASTSQCFEELRAKKFTTIATALTDTSESLYDMELTEPDIALVFGNEHRGLSEEAIALSDRVLRIPMRGMVQSLNLSVTAALCLYEVSRQRHHFSEGKYSYSPEEKLKIQQDLQ